MARPKKPKDRGKDPVTPLSPQKQAKTSLWTKISAHPKPTVYTLLFFVITLSCTSIWGINNAIKSNKIIEKLDKLISQQAKLIDSLIKEGRIPLVLKNSLEPPQIGTAGARGTLGITPAGTAPKQFFVTGKFESVPKGKEMWIGTLSGLQFWPQCNVSSEIREGQPFKKRITIPERISSGKVILVEAGDEANQLFKRWWVGQYHEVGLFWPHLKDAQVIASETF